MDQYTVETMMNLPASQLLYILENAKALVDSIHDELAEAVCEYKRLERLLPKKLAQIQLSFLDKKMGYNETLARAKATDAYEKELQKLNEAYEIKKPLEIKYEIFLHTVDCLKAISYLKNRELKTGI